MPPSAFNVPVPCPPTSTRTAIRPTATVRARAAAVALAATALLAGCGQPVQVTAQPTGSATATSTAPSTARESSPSRPAVAASPGDTPNGTPSPVFAEHTAEPCRGYPSGDQIVALLRRTSGLVPATGTVTVGTGPLCAGTWQYTVVLVPDRDPLQVVTKGSPQALELVTAGTDVCTVEVRAVAPAGIRAITRC